MDILDIFAFAVFAILIVAAMVVIVGLGMLPGRVAEKRGHPQAAAINVAGWLGVATMGLLWPLALIWAFTKPHAGEASASSESNQIAQLQARIAKLETALRELPAQKETR